MKAPRILTTFAFGAALTLGAHAQMSSFPAPPPLASPSASASTSAPAPAAPAPTASGSGANASARGASGSPALTAGSLNSIEALDNKTTLQDGDTISFRVIEDRDDPVQRVVTDTGEVDFPYIGPVKVEGRTCHEVALDVKKRLEVDYYKQATVIIGLDRIVGQDNDTKPKDLAWVMGEVRSVGPLELMQHQPMTVSQLIMRAGGFGDFADQRKVKLLHRADGGAPSAGDINNSKDFQVIDVKSIFDGQSAADPQVKAGDYIIVPKKVVNF